MRKEYQKPEIVFENFAISTSIAAGCEHITNLSGRDACGYMLRNGDIIFLSSSTGCGTPNASGTYGEGDNSICYHNPGDNYNVFNS